MHLRYEVSPSEAGTVVDGLIAQGLPATLLTRHLGDSLDTVSLEVVESDVVRARALVADLASTATEVPAE